MKRLILLTVILTLSTQIYAQQQYSKIRIYGTSSDFKFLAEQGVGIDHGTYKNNTYFQSDFSQTDIATIRSFGYEVDVLIEDVTKYYQDQNLKTKNSEKAIGCEGSSSNEEIETPTNFQLGTMGGYYKYQEFLDELDAMASQYPNLITVKAPISDTLTIEGRPLYFVKISDNANTDEAETEVMYSAIHHAREPASLSQLIFYMWYMLENYDTSDEVQYLVDNLEMYFVPMINPDGYYYNETTDPNGGGMHRKNRRNVGTSNKGVDLNRNYPYQWGTTGVDFDMDDDTYPGTAAFSEAETQNMKKFVQTHNFAAAFNTHTYGDLILFPIGATDNEFAADHDHFQLIGNHMAEESGFVAQKSSGLYPASGDSDDWAYLDHGVHAMTPEVGPSFWPASNEIDGICKGTTVMNKRMAHLALNYALTHNVDPNSVEDMSGYFHYNIQRLGQQNGSFDVSMEALAGIQTLGATNNYPTLTMDELKLDSISYVLDPAIQGGDEIKYVIKTDNGDWSTYDTVIRIYGSAPVVSVDNGDNLVNWTNDGWGTTTNEYYSPSSSITDSPNGNYQDDVESSIELTEEIDLTTATTAKVEFYAMWEIETDYDYATFEVSIDNGSSWQQLCGKYTNNGVEQTGWGGQNNGIQPVDEPLYDGVQSSWVLEEVSLNDYVGQTIKLRFFFASDGGERQDGFYFDDFKILHDGTPDVGLDELDLIQLGVFPNPASDQVQFVLPNDVSATGNIELLDESGRLVKVIKVDQNKMTVQTSDLPNGIYFYKFYNNEIRSSINKFVVLK
jgi:hypothetical protein